LGANSFLAWFLVGTSCRDCLKTQAAFFEQYI
jgi:hypothetical protein